MQKNRDPSLCEPPQAPPLVDLQVSHVMEFAEFWEQAETAKGGHFCRAELHCLSSRYVWGRNGGGMRKKDFRKNIVGFQSQFVGANSGFSSHHCCPETHLRLAHAACVFPVVQGTPTTSSTRITLCTQRSASAVSQKQSQKSPPTSLQNSHTRATIRQEFGSNQPPRSTTNNTILKSGADHNRR